MNGFLNQDKFLDDYFNELIRINNDLGKMLSKEIKNSEKESDIKGYSSVLACFNLIHQDINYIKDNSFITDGGMDKSFDVLYIDEKNKTIDILDVKASGGGFGDNDLNDLKTYIERYLINRETLFDGNKRLKNIMPKIYEFIDTYSGNISIRFFVFKQVEEKNKTHEFEKTKNEIKELLIGRYKNINVLFFDIGIEKRNELITKMLYNLNSNEFKYLTPFGDKKFNLSILNSLPEVDGTKVIITNLYSLLKFINSSRNELNLYKMNVRDYKKDTSKNKTFEESVLNESTNFIKYHNGVTIVCKKYEEKNIGNEIIIYEPQIVNGQQSIERLYELFYTDLNLFDNFRQNNGDIDLNKVKNVLGLQDSKILIKIISNCIDGNTNNVFLTEKISEYTNDQKEIEKHELRTNDIINLIIPKILKIRKINVNYPEYIQLSYACLYFDVKLAKNDKKKIFSINQNNIYQTIIEKMSLEDIINICLYKNKIDIFDFSIINGLSKSEINSFNDFISYYIVVGLNLLNNRGKIININSDIEKLGNILYKIYKTSGKDIRKLFQVEGDYVINEFLFAIENLYGISNSKYFIPHDYNLLDFNSFNKKFELLNVYKISLNDYKNLVKLLGFKESNFDNLNFIVNEYNSIISYKNYNLNRLNNYKKHKDLTGNKLKAKKYIIDDILKDNPNIKKEDVLEILKLFYSNYWDNLDSENFKEDIYSYLDDLGNSDNKNYYLLIMRGSNAKGIFNDGKILVLKDSIGPKSLQTQEAENKGYAYRNRPKLIKEGVIKEEGDNIVFLKDYQFDSPSSASSLVTGGSFNGWDVWKDENGKTLDEIERKDK